MKRCPSCDLPLDDNATACECHWHDGDVQCRRCLEWCDPMALSDKRICPRCQEWESKKTIGTVGSKSPAPDGAARWCIRWTLPTGTIRRDYVTTPEELLSIFQHAEHRNAATIEVTRLQNNSLTVGGTPYRAGTGSQEDRT